MTGIRVEPKARRWERPADRDLEAGRAPARRGRTRAGGPARSTRSDLTPPPASRAGHAGCADREGPGLRRWMGGTSNPKMKCGPHPPPAAPSSSANMPGREGPQTGSAGIGYSPDCGVPNWNCRAIKTPWPCSATAPARVLASSGSLPIRVHFCLAGGSGPIEGPRPPGLDSGAPPPITLSASGAADGGDQASAARPRRRIFRRPPSAAAFKS
jgi:hypothetical protein